MKCADCKFYLPDDGPFEVGECRRYAPRPVVIAGEEEGEERRPRPRLPVWPIMLPEGFCGEFYVKREPVF